LVWVSSCQIKLHILSIAHLPEALDLHDRDIIEGFLAGRKREYEILVQWIEELTRIKLHIKSVSSEEIVSDTMYKLLNNFRSDSFQLREKLKSYVQAVAAYTIIDHVRFRKRYTELPEREDPPESGRIEEDVQAKEQQVILNRIFALMSEECRKLWHLRFVDDLDYKEIGAWLGISEGTVKVRFHRCKKQAIAIREKIM
jgi:RNA polymerase sigma factor (sigma-70 family)